MSEKIRGTGEPESSPEVLLRVQEFRDKIQGIKGREMKKKAAWYARGQRGKAHQPEFDTIEPRLLGEREMAIYDKFETGEITQVDQFLPLRNEEINILNGLYSVAQGDSSKLLEYQSRNSFLAWLLNRVGDREELEEKREQRRQKRNSK